MSKLSHGVIEVDTMGGKMFDKIWRKLVTALVFATIIIILYNIVLGTIHTNIRYLLSYYAFTSLAILLIGWIISAFRLKIIVESSFSVKSIGLFDCVKARFLGGLLANITPSSIGGEPARALYISRLMDIDLTSSYAMAIYEVYYDVITVNLIGFILSTWYLPRSIPVLLVSISMTLSWIGIHVYLKNRSIVERTAILLGKILPKDIVARIYSYISNFAQHYHNISQRVGLGKKIIITFLTILYNSVWGMAIVPLQYVRHVEVNAESIMNAISSYYMMQSISALPTPGGSGVAEYGLLIGLEPSVAMIYRIIYYYSTILIGLIVLTTTMRRDTKNH
ncbi:MAG: lysylphosphatidylglycerol synthase transmembrane domain-containing protein [Desulfurococcaceae archaeon]